MKLFSAGFICLQQTWCKRSLSLLQHITSNCDRYDYKLQSKAHSKASKKMLENNENASVGMHGTEKKSPNSNLTEEK